MVFDLSCGGAVVPLYVADEARHGTRNDAAWREACDENDVPRLRAMGLS